MRLSNPVDDEASNPVGDEASNPVGDEANNPVSGPHSVEKRITTIPTRSFKSGIDIEVVSGYFGL